MKIDIKKIQKLIVKPNEILFIELDKTLCGEDKEKFLKHLNFFHIRALVYEEGVVKQLKVTKQKTQMPNPKYIVNPPKNNIKDSVKRSI